MEGEGRTEGFLLACVRPNTVNCGCAAKFPDLDRKVPAGEEEHQTLVLRNPRDRCLCITKHPARPGPWEERVDNGREVSERSYRKTTERASRELDTPQSSPWRPLRKCLRVKPYGLPFRHSRLTIV